jgi:Trk K+ transport system NAD-binding subunit
MSNPLLAFWHLLFDDDERRRLPRPVPLSPETQASATIFLVLRRMRAPLIVLIVIFAISVLGLTLIPGRDDAGRPWRMTFFDAFYVMSYTATTIGYGELPRPFSAVQRMWVTFSIYLTVIGWAYAIGSLLALLQDRGFRDALQLRSFTRKVTRLREPFLLVAGYGQTGRLLGHALDDRGRRFVVIDSSEFRIEGVELDGYHADVPGLAGDARHPGHLAAAGLGHPYCEGVVAITNDNEVNLAVTMTTALMRPELPVIARTTSRVVAQRMAEFGDPVVINPFDRFGDRLRLALRAPSAYRLLSYLTSTGDGGPPPLREAPPHGRWVVCGPGQFGREISEDLRTEGFDVTAVEPDEVVLARADLASAVGLVAATGNDTTNLSVVAAARRANRSLFLVARENLPTNSPLYEAMRLDALLVPPDIVAREALARLGHPLLWDFLADVPTRDDAWSARLLDRLVPACGDQAPHLWDVQVTAEEAPAVVRRAGAVRLADILRDPEDRDSPLDAVPLLLMRGGRRYPWPDGDLALAEDDEILFAGRPAARHVLEGTLLTDASLEYVVSGRRIPSGWVWRRLSERVGERS